MAGNPEKPYIGITGVGRPKQAQVIASSFAAEGLTEINSTHQGMIGVLASQMTLATKPESTERHPDLTRIRQIFEATGGKTFNTLHYSTNKSSDLAQQLSILLNRNGLYTDRLCGGMQLNLAWPPSSELEKTKERFPNLKIIIQLGPRILSDGRPEEIMENLTPYKSLMDYVLIDPSGGKGMLFEINTVAPVYNQIKNVHPDLPIIFAGGFNPSNVGARLWLLFQLVGTTNFGLDAERGLRIQKKGQLITPLSTNRAKKYIHNAVSFFRNHPSTSNP